MSDVTRDDILSWDTNRLWNEIQLLDNKEEYTVEISQVKFGDKIKIPIWWIMNEWYEIYPSSARIKIKGYGKYKIWSFMEEKEWRDNLMRNILIENITQLNPVGPRA